METQYRLIYQTQEGPTKSIPLQGNEWTLGRSSDNRVPISDTTISRHHVVLQRRNDSFYLRELAPKNPVLDETLQPLFPQTDPGRPSVPEAKLVQGQPLLLGSTWIWVEAIDTRVTRITKLATDNSLLMPPMEGINYLSKWSEALLQQSDMESQAMSSLETIGNLIPYRRGIIGMFEANDNIRLLAFLEADGKYRPSRPEIILSDTVAGRIKNRKAPFIVADTKEDASLQDRQSINALGIHTVLAVPLIWHNEVKGLIYLDRDSFGKSFQEIDMQAIVLVANLLANAFKTREIEQDLATRRNRDADRDGNLPERHPIEAVGSSRVFQQHLNELRGAAEHNVGTIIQGETGSGKEVAAHLIHKYSTRQAHPFISLDCDAIPAEIIERELFGYTEKASAPGLNPRGQRGVTQMANGGTLYLEEPWTLTLETQAKLVEILKTLEVTPLGSDQPVPANFRLIVGSTKNLETLYEEKEFHGDLFDALSGFTFFVPPLGQRDDDVIALAQTFLNQKADNLGIATPKLSHAAKDLLCSYHWPGNVRELRHFMEQTFTIGAKTMVTPDELPAELQKSAPGVPVVRLPMATVERTHMQKVLSYCRGNVRMAARVLGIATSTLYDKIKRYGLEDEVDRTRTVRRTTGQPANQKHNRGKKMDEEG